MHPGEGRRWLFDTNGWGRTRTDGGSRLANVREEKAFATLATVLARLVSAILFMLWKVQVTALVLS